MNSRKKGSRGELELAKYLTASGAPARRGQQFAGSTDSPDVLCQFLEGWHIECKRVERLDLYAAIAQAAKDAGDKLPLVIHRRNRSKWYVTVALDNFLPLLGCNPPVKIQRRRLKDAASGGPALGRQA